MATSSGTLSEAQALAAIKAAGFPQDQWATALAIAKAESGLNPTAVNTANRNGTRDYGLFQINSIHKPTAAEKTDPVANSKRAYSIYKAAGSKWTPWSTYNAGLHKKFIEGTTKFVTGASGVAINATTGAMDAAGSVTGLGDKVREAVASVLAKVEEILNVSILVIIALLCITIGIVILLWGPLTDAFVKFLTKGVGKIAGKAGKASKAVNAGTSAAGKVAGKAASAAKEVAE